MINQSWKIRFEKNDDLLKIKLALAEHARNLGQIPIGYRTFPILGDNPFVFGEVELLCFKPGQVK